MESTKFAKQARDTYKCVYIGRGQGDTNAESVHHSQNNLICVTYF